MKMIKNQMEKTMENEMETGFAWGFRIPAYQCSTPLHPEH